MIITKLQGGLGNQMFQYALAKKIALMHNTEVWLDVSHFNIDGTRKFNLQPFKLHKQMATPNLLYLFDKLNDTYKVTTWYKLKKKIFKFIVIKEPHVSYSADMLNKSMKNTYLDGYWQTEKYFADIRENLLGDFTITEEAKGKNAELLLEISSCNSVSLHIRRGDYVSNNTTNAIHGVCSIEYYNTAINYIKERVKSPVLYVFSDDMPWVKANLKTDLQVHYIDHNNGIAYEDMRLMRMCKHNIIANSSFSWWGAWLNTNPNKIVVAPQKWYKMDIYNINDIYFANTIKL